MEPPSYLPLRPLLLALPFLLAASPRPLPYPIVGTGLTRCYDDRHEIAPPVPGHPFHGQDAQHPGPKPAYRDNHDGTITDLNTGLIWVKARGQKMNWEDAKNGAASCRVGRYTDWRMPTIKELYSLIDFNGTGGFELSSSRPYLDSRYFEFAYGDTSKGYRLIDCQDWSATEYRGTTMGGNPTAFGVNFADGRIKGYPKTVPGGRVTQMYVRYVRGNPAYGKNDFHDNGDGTISDLATGLMWQKADSGKGMNWQDALAYAASSRVAGHSDWRLPNAKELQSIVDYTRSPSATQSAAISPLFTVSKLSDGDYPFYWSSTTHLDGPPGRALGGSAVYVAFGRATGWRPPHPGGGGPPRPPGPSGRNDHQRQGPPPFRGPGEFGPPQSTEDTSNYQLMDVHGAGAQRSDPKAGNPADFPKGRGPQGDVIRIYNYVRLVRTL